MFRLVATITAAELSPDAEQHKIAMRDGVRLATDIYLPASPSRHPAVFVRTPYDKASRYTGLRTLARCFVDEGYVFVAQDVRGKFRSEGQTVPYAFDVADSYDTIDWIVKQPWSDQTVGLLGASYSGYTAWAGVACGHPAVRAAVVQVTGVEMGDNHVGGRWRQVVPSMLSFNDLIQIWTTPDDYLVEIDYRHRPVGDIYASAKTVLGSSFAMEAKLARTRTGEYYNPYQERHPYYTTNIPVLHWVNWFDPGLAPSGVADYRRFRGVGGRRDLHFYRGDSADHGGFRLEDLGKGDIANPYISDEAEATVNTVESRTVLEFFDACRTGSLAAIPRARWHLGHVGWRSSPDWPPPQAVIKSLYTCPADADGEANVGRLAGQAQSAAKTLEWVHDPQDPVPSTTSCEENWTFLAANPDDAPLRRRNDVLTFETEPLTKPLNVVGHPQAQLNLEFSSASSHVFCVLSDVFPAGRVLPVAHGRVVVEARNVDRPLLVDLAAVSYSFQTGHRLQFQISSSSLPWSLVHLGTEENPWLAVRSERTRQQLVCGGAAPSAITLPVLEAP
jgi:uncharacterized protein